MGSHSVTCHPAEVTFPRTWPRTAKEHNRTEQLACLLNWNKTDRAWARYRSVSESVGLAGALNLRRGSTRVGLGVLNYEERWCEYRGGSRSGPWRVGAAVVRRSIEGGRRRHRTARQRRREGSQVTSSSVYQPTNTTASLNQNCQM